MLDSQNRERRVFHTKKIAPLRPCSIHLVSGINSSCFLSVLPSKAACVAHSERIKTPVQSSEFPSYVHLKCPPVLCRMISPQRHSTFWNVSSWTKLPNIQFHGFSIWVRTHNPKSNMEPLKHFSLTLITTSFKSLCTSSRNPALQCGRTVAKRQVPSSL